jgi:hypothetical protein
MMVDYHGYIKVHLKREAALLEEMCEQMLTTTGSPGISVQRSWKGLICTTEFRFSPEVPFGTIAFLLDVSFDA